MTDERTKQRQAALNEPRGCDCCDPTSDSADPVVRLEREVEAANLRINQLETECGHLQADLHEAGDGDTWREAAKRLEGEVDRLNARLLQIHTAAGEAVANPPSQIDAFRMLKDDNARLRGLLREAGRMLWEHHESRVSALLPGTVCPICEKSRIFYRIEAALEGKP